MGQYWKLINLDKRETFGCWGKLGEWLFEGSEHLLFSLMVATKPPKLPECDSLIRPYKQGVVLENWLTKTFRSPPKADQRSHLVKLPLEIIDEIFSHLGSMEDLVFLSMTCQALWEIGRHAMYRRVASKIAALSWVGDRIICVGDYLRNEDIPKNLLTAEEQKEVEEYDSLYEFPFDLQISTAERQRRVISDLFLGGRVIRLLLQRDAFIDYTLLLSLVDTSFELEWPRSAACVLRNLSRRQYVRGTTLTEWREKTTAIIPQVKHITFSEIILCRICLSSDPSVSMSYKGNIHRGVWAGDRFDFVGKDWADGWKDEDEAWTDVSAEVLGEVEAIWASEYGRRR